MKTKFITAASLLSLAFAATSCCSTGASASLVGTTWKMVEYQGEPFEALDNYNMLLNSDGGVGGVADCNSFMGDYILSEDGGIDITNKALTRAMCQNDAMEQEYIKMLEEGDSYKISGDQLEWIIGGNTVAVFEAQNEAE